MEKAEIRTLIRAAFEGQGFAYAPYSRFHVGAALRAKDGRVFKGCNIENAGYTATNCAERTALFKAVSEGHRDFVRIVIAGRSEGLCVPCGVCRQVMAEFCAPGFEILLTAGGAVKAYALEELLPQAFGPGNLQ